MRTSLSLLCVVVALSNALYAAEHVIKSPDGNAVVTIDVSNEALTYDLAWKGERLLKPSVISLFDKAEYEVLNVVVENIDETWEPTWGQFSEIRDHCQRLTIELKASGRRVDLVCQAYDDGVGFRFVAPAQAGMKGRELHYQFECEVEGAYDAYSGAPGAVPEGPISSEILAKGGTKFRGSPLMIDNGKGAWMALLESDLFSAELFNIAMPVMKPKTETVRMVTKAVAGAEDFVTPWRVILLAEKAVDLMTNNVALNLAAPCQLDDTSWIQTGVGIWDWRVHGYDNGDFKYGINTKSFLHYIDFCKAEGIPFFTIDDHWFLKAGGGKMKVSPNVDIKKVMAYAKEKEVGIMLYYDRKKGNFGDKTLFKHYAELGAVGIKYGFMGSNTKFTRDTIRLSAEAKLMIFYHDGPATMTGVERTMPHMISREYCHGQQDSRSAFLPSTFVKMAMINSLTGPLDMSNGNFGLKGINAGERKKGPKKKRSYISTVVSEVARCVIIPSGLVTLPDAPEEYLKKPDLFAFLKEMPATWDETRAINGEIGDYVTVARRSGDMWFVGAVNSEEKPRELKLQLDFLKQGVDYEVTLYEDAEEAHGMTNQEVYKITKEKVNAASTIDANMVMGGGHAMIIRPL